MPHFKQYLQLTRADLAPEYRDMEFYKINLTHFKFPALTEMIERETFIVFINQHPDRCIPDFDKTRILKHTTGYAGLVVPVKIPQREQANKESKGIWQYERDERGFAGYRCANCGHWTSIPSSPMCKCDQVK